MHPFQNLTMQWIRNLRRHHWNIGIYTIFLTTALYVYGDECHKKDQRRLVTDFTDFEAPLVVGPELAPSQVPTPRFLCAGLFLGALAIQR